MLVTYPMTDGQKEILEALLEAAEARLDQVKKEILVLKMLLGR